MRYARLRSWLALVPMVALPMNAPGQSGRGVKPMGWQFAHPDARLLLGLDWKQVRAYPAGETLARQVREGGHPLLSLLSAIDGVERLLISSPGPGAGPAPLLAIAQGPFSLRSLRTSAAADGAVSRRYNGFELLAPPQATNRDLHFALIDATTILFGDGGSVKGAINRHLRGEQPEARNFVFARARALAVNHDAWLVAENPSSSLAALGPASVPLFGRLNSLEFLVRFRDAAVFELTLYAETEAVARGLYGGLAPLAQMLAAQSARPELLDLPSRLRLAQDRQAIRVTLSLDRANLERTLLALRQSGPRPATDGLPVAQSGAAVEGARPERRFIRIVGMEGGIREIPYPPVKPE